MGFVTLTQYNELMNWVLHIKDGQSLIYWGQNKMPNIFKQLLQVYF